MPVKYIRQVDKRANNASTDQGNFNAVDRGVRIRRFMRSPRIMVYCPRPAIRKSSSLAHSRFIGPPRSKVFVDSLRPLFSCDYPSAASVRAREIHCRSVLGVVPASRKVCHCFRDWTENVLTIAPWKMPSFARIIM